MTDIQPSEAAALLADADRSRRSIRRKVGTGAFEFALFGVALLVTGAAGIVAGHFDSAQIAVCAAAFGVAYLFVAARDVRLHRRFGLGRQLFRGLAMSAGLFVAIFAAGWLLHDKTLLLGMIPYLSMTVINDWLTPKKQMIPKIFVIWLAGILIGALPFAPEGTAAAIAGAGFLGLAVIARRAADLAAS